MWQEANIYGLDFSIYRQDDVHSCGPAAVATLMRIVNDEQTWPQAKIKWWFVQAEENLMGEGKIFSQRLAGDVRRVKDFSGGASFTALGRVLIDNGKNFSVEKDYAISLVRPHAPAIARFSSPNGSGHFVVCLGEINPVGAGYRVFLDPANGLVVNKKEHWPFYDPAGGDQRPAMAQDLIRTRPRA